MTARAPGVGANARSRELGYSDAMSEVSVLLRAEAHRWTESAKREDPVLCAVFTLAAAKLREVVSYTDSAGELYLDHRSPLDEKSFVQLDWRHRGDAPRELPAGGTA